MENNMGGNVFIIFDTDVKIKYNQLRLFIGDFYG